jgi:YVTN family beta-propeller protein
MKARPRLSARDGTAASNLAGPLPSAPAGLSGEWKVNYNERAIEKEYFMYNISGNGTRTAPARSVAALWAMLAMGLGLLASPAEAAPFAYVGNNHTNTVSVIDTASNTVVATVPVGNFPIGVAVTPDGKLVYVVVEGPAAVSVIDAANNTVVATVPVGDEPVGVAVAPDGKHAYITRQCRVCLSPGTVSVIDTATNTVVATVTVGASPSGIAVAPDGKRAFVANEGSNTVSVIDTATNTVVATVPVGNFPDGVAVTPDGKHVYVTIVDTNTTLVIDTASNTVVATVPVGNFPIGVAVTPDGKRAYVANEGSNTVSVIDTVTNAVVAAPITVGNLPRGVAVTPDGKHAYVTNAGSTTVSVIDTATNTVVATVPVGNSPQPVGIIPPPVGVPFLAFNAKLQIDIDRDPKKDAFALESSFTLSSGSNGIHPVTEPVTLQIGTFSTTIPPGSFKKHEHEGDEDEGEGEDGSFTFHGVIDGVRLKALIKRTGTLRYAFFAKATGAELTGTKNPVQVTLTIGDDSGATSVTARIR